MQHTSPLCLCIFPARAGQCQDASPPAILPDIASENQHVTAYYTPPNTQASLPCVQAGIKIGQQVTAVSDPNFPNQLLDTSRQASKIGVTRSLSLRISPTIDMAFGDVPKTLKSIGECCRQALQC